MNRKIPNEHGYEYWQKMDRLLSEEDKKSIAFLCDCKVVFMSSAMWKCHKPWYVKWRKVSNFFMIIINRGQLQVKIENETRVLKKGDIFLSYPGQRHSYGLAENQNKVEHQIIHFNIKSVHYPILNGLFTDSFFQLPDKDKTIFDKFQILPKLWDDHNRSVYSYAHCLLKDLFLQLTLTNQVQLCSVEPLDIRISEAVKFFNENLIEEISIIDVADKVNLSEAQFRKVFRQQMHRSPLKYLTEIRLHKACSLLQKTSDSINHIALSCGFADPDYFSRTFKKHYQCTPGQYRKMINN